MGLGAHAKSDSIAEETYTYGDVAIDANGDAI